MFTWQRQIFDFVFPPSEDELIVRALTEKDMRVFFNLTHVNPQTIALTSYNNSHVRALIHEAKFHGSTRAHMLLSHLLDQYIEMCASDFDLIIPIPLSYRRHHARGYNQVTEVIKTNREIFPKCRENILIRKRNTKPQTELHKKHRLINLKDAFAVRNGEFLLHKNILLIDDVTTTGTTLKEARRALLPHKPTTVTCLALAH